MTAIAIRWLLSNPWRAIALVLVLVVGGEWLLVRRLHDTNIKQRLEASIALDANRAAMDGLHRAQAEAKAANERAVVWERNTRAVEAARAEQARKDAARLAKAQSALQKALAANAEWAKVKTPEAVKRALR